MGLAEPADELSAHSFPHALPGGKAVLFTIRREGVPNSLGIMNLETGEQRVLIENGSYPQYVPAGYVLFSRDGTLAAAPFDIDRLELTGTPITVVADLRVELAGASQFSVSEDGTLAYLPAYRSLPPRSEVVQVDRQGAAQTLLSPGRRFGSPRLSPDGRHLAVRIIDDEGGSDIWIQDLQRDTLIRLTYDGASAHAAWSRNGKQVFFASTRSDTGSLFSRPADGSSMAIRLTDNYPFATPTSVDESTVIFWFRNGDGNTVTSDVASLSLSDGDVTLLLQSPFHEEQPALSPEGRWLAYTSNESGRREVYVQPYAGEGSRWLVSTNGGTEPVWSPDGKELFYREQLKMMSVPVASGPSLDPGKPRVLFEGKYASEPSRSPNYHVTPDGQHFVMIRPIEEPPDAPKEIHVVLNWFEELKRLVPTDN